MIAISNTDHWLLEQAINLPEQTAVELATVKFSYRELYNQSKIAAEYFTKKGIRKSDHVSIITNHGLEFILVINALWLIGAIPIPLNNKLSSQELIGMLNVSKSRFLINFCKRIDFQDDEKISVIDFSLKAIKGGHNKIKHPKYDPNLVCLMLFTSGSTGNAKCVQLTFNNIFESAYSVDRYINHTLYDNWLASLPFYHIGGFSIITRSIICGCRLIVPDKINRDGLFNAIVKYRPSLVSLVHPMMIKLLKDFKKPWNDLRHLFVGGGPVSLSIIQESIENFWPVSVVYGSTETASMVSVSSSMNLAQNGLSSGLPMEGVELKLENQKEGLSDLGNVIIKSKSVSPSYFNYISEEPSPLRNGAYFSNDLGKIDGKGNLHILGRSDDIIISGGENISLSEIENILNEASIYGRCSAIAVEDTKWGQSYIVFSDSKTSNAKGEILKFLNNRIARFKLPKKVIILDKMPENDISKIRKEELRKMLKFDSL